MADTVDSISLFRSLLWLVAAAIVGSVLYLSALERSRDIAVLKATGAGGADLVLGLVLQAVVLAIGASIAAIVLAELLAPLFPAGISLPTSLLAMVPVVALLVGVVGSLAGLRRVLRVDPALAFGGP
jgi:putative ABC transport system permease protein